MTHNFPPARRRPCRRNGRDQSAGPCNCGFVRPLRKLSTRSRRYPARLTSQITLPPLRVTGTEPSGMIASKPVPTWVAAHTNQQSEPIWCRPYRRNGREAEPGQPARRWFAGFWLSKRDPASTPFLLTSARMGATAVPRSGDCA